MAASFSDRNARVALLGGGEARCIAPVAAESISWNVTDGIYQVTKQLATKGKMLFVFGMVVLATLLIAAPAGHAACNKSEKHL